MISCELAYLLGNKGMDIFRQECVPLASALALMAFPVAVPRGSGAVLKYKAVAG